MLHLLPVKWLLIGYGFYCAAVSLATTQYGADGVVSANQLLSLAKALYGAPALLIAVVYLAWRFSKPLQMRTFPKLGGEWTGHICYTARGQIEKKPAIFHVKHSFSGIVIALDTEESTSRTLVVSPYRDETGSEFKLYYVFHNERKPDHCVVGKPRDYRGVAIISIGADLKTIKGQYFTDQGSSGTIDFRISKPSWF